MIQFLSDQFIFLYNKKFNKLMPQFEKIAHHNDKEEDRFLSISLALRIAARLSTKFGYSKDAFLSAASGNYDLEIKNKKDLEVN